MVSTMVSKWCEMFFRPSTIAMNVVSLPWFPFAVREKADDSQPSAAGSGSSLKVEAAAKICGKLSEDEAREAVESGGREGREGRWREPA